MMTVLLLKEKGSVSPTNLFLLQPAPLIPLSAFKILGGILDSSLLLTPCTWSISTAYYV